MEPVQVSIVGSGTGHGGSLMPPSGTIAETPRGQPDLVVNIVRPSVAVAVRFIHVFLTTFVGVIGAAGIGAANIGPELLAAGNFGEVMKTAALVAASSAGVGALKDIITVFGRLENKYPLVTGSI
jgi:hypothetical protein